MPPRKDSSPAAAGRESGTSGREGRSPSTAPVAAARALQAGHAVLVAFDGWSSQWNEWVAKDSKRLRPPRGWGTGTSCSDEPGTELDEPRARHGRQQKWYPAKVLHVSELRVQVHYQRWSSKWDEWIDISPAGMRKLHASFHDEQEAKGALDERESGPRARRHRSMVGAVCEEPRASS